MTGSGMRKSSSGTANISDNPANSSSGIASISGGVAAASIGTRGGMAVQTDDSGGSNGSRGGMAVQTDGSGGSNAGISSTARQGIAQANATALAVDRSKFPVKVWPFDKTWSRVHTQDPPIMNRHKNEKPNYVHKVPVPGCTFRTPLQNTHTQGLQKSKFAPSSLVVTAHLPVSTCCMLLGPSHMCWPSQVCGIS